MQELYFPEAVILDKEDSNDFDSRFSIYAKGYGKIYAKAKSAKKILSKLAGHLEPGSLVKIRLVGNGGCQVADALKFGKIAVDPPDLYFLDRLLPEQDFDFAIWKILNNSKPPTHHLAEQELFDWKKVLRILGWDPEHAICEICKTGKPAYFDLRNQGFMCEECFLKNAGKVFHHRTRDREILKID